MFSETIPNTEQRCIINAKDAVCSHIIAVGLRSFTFVLDRANDIIHLAGYHPSMPVSSPIAYAGFVLDFLEVSAMSIAAERELKTEA